MELTKISGINQKRESDLNKLEIFSTLDLIKFFPRKYLDLTTKQSLKYAYHNDIVLTLGTVVSQPTTKYFKKLSQTKISCEQEGFFFQVIWYNQPYVASKLKVGEEYLFYGRVRLDDFSVSLTNPSFEEFSKNYRLKGIVPQYQLKGNLTQKVVRDSVKLSVNIEKPQSIIPLSLQNKYGLENLYWAYRQVHNPESFNSLYKASDRIAVEEYFALISAFKIIKGDKDNFRYNKYSVNKEDFNDFIKSSFPFEFTEGQTNATNEIFNDLTSNKRMNRLLQGDVGSGKTAVSLSSIYLAVKSGYQAVMLAPTEVLATQNYSAVCNVFGKLNVALLTGSTPLKEKKQIKQRLKSGEIQILVGTHAVLTDDVEFKNLSLCVCDEQQRFGVSQRSALLNKGVFPDVLVMSATPIPRTLSLIFYGDLDVTTIYDKPKQRLPVQTNVVPKEKYLDMLKFIENKIKIGEQAYFVTPKIDGDEEGTVAGVIETFEELKRLMPSARIALLHGKLKDKEKNAVMLAFKNKEYDVLVSTTVIEVGVDVKDATVMVIKNAERFGLSQLHQLRGRVGRSNIKSFCFLMSNLTTEGVMERLNVLVAEKDGFKIAEKDYKMRGSGDFFGSRQSGKTISDLGYLSYDTEAIFLAKKLADECFNLGMDIDLIKKVAMEKYNKIKDVTLN